MEKFGQNAVQKIFCIIEMRGSNQIVVITLGRLKLHVSVSVKATNIVLEY